MRDLNGKVAVVTGAASGIGRALAIQFAKEGAKVAISDVDIDGLENTVELVKKEGGEVHSQLVDVSSKEAVYSWAEDVVRHFGGVDIVINNAGVALGRVNLSEIEYKDFEWVMGINFWGMVYGTKAFLPHLKQRPEAAVANISSLFGIMGTLSQGAYCTSKFAIRGFTETLRMELIDEAPHVKTHTIHPGGIDTNIARNSKDVIAISAEEREAALIKTQKSLKMPPSRAANIIIKGIKKKKERIMVGSDAKILDRIVRLFPSRYSRIVVSGLKKMGLTEDNN